jgi:hypothetical protein
VLVLSRSRFAVRVCTDDKVFCSAAALSPTALVATGELVVNRGDYAITYNSFLNPIGNEVRVSFTFRARAS